MTQANLKVVGVVGWCNFNTACSKLFVHIRICNYRNFPIGKGKQQGFSDNVLIAFIFRIYRNRSIAEQRFGTCCSNDNNFIAPFYRIFNVPKMAGLFCVFNLCIWKRSNASGTPVYNSWALIDKPFFIEIHKNLFHCFGAAFVHGKAFPCPVAGAAQLFQLINNPVAIELFPLPHLFHKLFAAQVVAGFTLFLAQHFLHFNLGGNTGVVGSGNPKGIKACHALVAD